MFKVNSNEEFNNLFDDFLCFTKFIDQLILYSCIEIRRIKLVCLIEYQNQNLYKFNQKGILQQNQQTIKFNKKQSSQNILIPNIKSFLTKSKYISNHKQLQMQKINTVVTRSLDLTYTQYLKKNKSLTGSVIGNYIVYQKLGQGAFGAVFKGMNDKTKELVAIRPHISSYSLEFILIEQFKTNKQRETTSEFNFEKQSLQYYKPQLQLKFSTYKQYRNNQVNMLIKTQAQMMAKCSSQNLIKCYQIFENKSLKLMVIQFCNGGNLDDQIQKNKYIPEEDAVNILKQILNGLAEMHKHGIIHRDLKPQNILIHDGTYKIADLGFSKQMKSNSTENQLKQTKLGTVSTMAPQVIQGKNYGLQADIWSIGVIFYNMLFGKLPFKKITYGQILNQIKNKNIFQSQHIPSHIKVSLQAKDLISKCLVLDSQKRLNWTNICSHQLFRKSQSSILYKTMRRDVQLKVLIMQKLGLTNVLQNDNESQKHSKQDSKQSPQKFKNQYSSQTTQSLTVLSKEQLLKKQKQITIPIGSSAYTWAKQAHLECLKTQFILNNIIRPLQSCSPQFLEQRQIVQILYLLSARCFNNMSFKNHESQFQNQKAVVDLKKLISNLYMTVHQKFKLYSDKLSKKQSQVKQIVKDKFFTLFKKQSQTQKDKFLTGIESNNKQGDLQSYSKNQQIQFTQNYFHANFKQICSQKNMSKKSINYIKKYNLICSLSLKDVGDEYFTNYVAKKFENQ